MMWTAHKIALFPSPVAVCGVPLLPPTVGQYQILEHLESPYVCGGMPFPWELITAVSVCSMPYRVAVWAIKRKWPLAIYSSWIAVRMRRRRIEWKDESKRFYRFCQECTWTPARFVEPGERKPMPNGIPSSYRIVSTLLGQFTEKQILAMSMPRANLYILAAAANRGNEFESLDDYEANGLPEGFAYHEEDYPELQKQMELARNQQAAMEAAQEKENAPITE